jgi:hypothetical protein
VALRDYAAPGGTEVVQQIGDERVTWTKTGRNEWQGWVGGAHRKLTGESALNLAANPPARVGPPTAPEIKANEFVPRPPGDAPEKGAPPTPPPPAPESWIARTGRKIAQAAGTPIAPPGAAVQSPWKAGTPPFASTPGEMGAAIKKNAPAIATDAVLGLVPGSGLAKSVLRGALATGAGTTAGAVTGQDPAEAALTSGVSAVAGEGLGGLARAGTRWAQGALSKTTEKVGDLIGTFVPSFKGATPRETIARVINGTGRVQLGEDYGAAVKGVLDQHGNPDVYVPALDKLGRSAAMPADQALKTIQSLRRGLFTGSGDVTRSKGTLEQIGWLEDAKAQLDDQLATKLPAGALQVMDQAKTDYARGMSILRLMSKGRETMSDAQIQSLLDKGRLNEPMLERAFLRDTGRLKARFTPQEYDQLADAIRRGEPNPLAISRVGKPAELRGSHGMKVPYMSLPHAPVRIGRPEEVADAVARAVRLFGAGGVQSTLNE